MSKVLEFWFDFSSPYAFFAAHAVEQVAQRHQCHLLWRPFMLGVAFKATGMQSLSHTPIRGDYARRDWARQARRLGVGFHIPSKHPVTALAPSRLFYWLEQRDAALAARYARRIFDAYFLDGLDISDLGIATAQAQSLCGLDTQTLTNAATDPDMKAMLKARTDEALQRGIFGSPFFMIDDEPFWGADRLPMVEEWLSTGGW